MIELLLKLIDKGIAYLREGERQKKLFFDEVVKPMHATFEKLYHDHLQTFEKAHAMLCDPATPQREIASFVRSQVLFQHGTTELLMQFTHEDDDGGGWRKPPSDDLRDYFESYVSCLAECLTSPTSTPRPLTLVYYATLTDVIDRLSSDGPTANNREWALKELERLLFRFQDFNARVVNRYLALQRHCSA